MFKPSRISSEAPEVTSGPEVIIRPASPEEIALSPRSATVQKHSSISASLWLEREDQSTDAGSRTLEHQELYQSDEAPPQTSTIERKWRRRRIIVMTVMVAVAFLAGGGIGGGVGSSVASKRSSAPTVTVTAPSADPTKTIIIDYAGCPSVNNQTYIDPKTNKRFLKICGSEIFPIEGQDIDLGNSVESSFDNCLNACAQTEGCVGATWFIFSALNPKKNSVCYFKDGIGSANGTTGAGQQLASGVLQV